MARILTTKDGIGRLIQRAQSLQAIPHELIVRQVTNRVLGDALGTVPREDGILAMSGGTDVQTPQKGRVQGRVYFGGSQAPYAAATEFGTALGGSRHGTVSVETVKTRSRPVGVPIPIVPVRTKALAFIGSEGDLVITKRVAHPGVPAQPYLYPAGDDGAKDLKNKVQAALHIVLVAL